MSAAGEDCSFGMDTDNYIGCAVAPADSISKDVNDNDDQTVGCAIARADIPSYSDTRILVKKMMTVVLRKHVTPLD
jgi:hypothetical protein